MYEESFHVTLGRFRIMKDAPFRSPIATAHVFIFVHGIHELSGLMTLYDVFDNDKHRPAFEVRAVFLFDRGHGPMDPGTEIGRCVW